MKKNSLVLPAVLLLSSIHYSTYTAGNDGNTKATNVFFTNTTGRELVATYRSGKLSGNKDFLQSLTKPPQGATIPAEIRTPKPAISIMMPERVVIHCRAISIEPDAHDEKHRLSPKPSRRKQEFQHDFEDADTFTLSERRQKEGALGLRPSDSVAIQNGAHYLISATRGKLKTEEQ